MEVVQVEGEDIQPEELDQGNWFEIKRSNRRRSDDVDPSRSDTTQLQRAKEATWSKKKGYRKIQQLIVASRMPNLPVDDYRIIIRPRGGFNVSEHATDRIYHSVRRAANVERTAEEEDNLCLNKKQNIIVLSTPSKERAKKYVAITSLSIGSKEYEACAYRAAPENTSKGVIRGISASESPEDIVKNLVTPRNPSVLYAKHLDTARTSAPILPTKSVGAAAPRIQSKTMIAKQNANYVEKTTRRGINVAKPAKKPKYNQQEQIGFPHKGQEQVTLQQSIKVKVHNPQCQAHQATPGHRQQQRHYRKPEHRTPITGELG
ncbi:hypothetical protein HPB52_025472 [Rhipicephalus sanguineus]|uniref:Uncharacterized protein n=1 Tax=Rhipicephalus sanguineus TaxID=34632 RepID=A0A9D4TD15_RHISA|nr:hypothetical protein HPB52_025472 [Rhipicephalus sanguineus]